MLCHGIDNLGSAGATAVSSEGQNSLPDNMDLWSVQATHRWHYSDDQGGAHQRCQPADREHAGYELCEEESFAVPGWQTGPHCLISPNSPTILDRPPRCSLRQRNERTSRHGLDKAAKTAGNLADWNAITSPKCIMATRTKSK